MNAWVCRARRVPRRVAIALFELIVGLGRLRLLPIALIAAFLVPGSCWAVRGITTAAGSNDFGDGFAADSALLVQPRGVAIDGSGNVYVSDPVTATIRKIAAGTNIITTIAGNGTPGYGGDGGLATAAAIDPFELALDSSGNLYFASGNFNVIRKIDLGTGIITTFAGNGNSAFSGDGGPATSASLSYPTGMSFDSSGNMYVADRINQRIRKIAAGTDTITTVAGNGTQGFSGDDGPATDASFFEPLDVAVDSSGNLYIADSFNSRIRKVTAATGTITTITGNGSPSYGGDEGDAADAFVAYPQSVAVDGAGNVYVADTRNDRIRRIDVATNIITSVAGTGVQGFSGDGGPAALADIYNPIAVKIDSGGNPLFSDTYNNRVRKITVSTGFISTVAGGGLVGDGGAATTARLAWPYGVATDSVNNVYVADFYNQRVRRIAAGTGIITTIAGTGTPGFAGDTGAATDARLYNPQGVAVDSGGNVYIADTANFCIRKVAAGTGIITTVAGNGVFGSSGDGGAATSASMIPYAVAVDGSGNFYVADNFGRTVRKVTVASGIITRIAGSGSAGFSGDGGAATSATLGFVLGLAIDAAGNVYIADTGNSRVRKVTVATGIITTVAGNGFAGLAGDGGLATAATVGLPRSVAVDGAGNLYIAHQGWIRKVVAANGVITTVAGTGGSGFSGDGGSATSATFNLPRHIALDGSGNLFVADADNNRVRKVTPGVPDAPLAPSATPGNAQATVTFSAPLDDGGSAITGYTVTSNPAGGADSNAGSTGTSHVVTGLASGTAYTFTVKATNAIGTGVASVASNSVTPSSTPGAPAIGTASPGNAQATVNFTAPASDGGSAITSYTATSSPGGLTGNCVAPCTQIVVSGLTNGTSYTFTVKATNAIGTGAASAASNAVTPATVPGAPSIGVATAGNAQITVSFSAAANNGSAITSYTATCGTQSRTGAGSPLTVTGLTNGTSYTCTVRATNGVGPGASSAASNAVTPKASSSTGLSASPAGFWYLNDSLYPSVSFTATVSGAAPTGSVTFTDAGAGMGCSAKPLNGGGVNTRTAVCTISTLTLGSHSIRATYNGNGSNTASSSGLLAYEVKQKGLSQPPTALVAVVGNQTATVSFVPPQDTGGSAITGYTVTATAVGGAGLAGARASVLAGVGVDLDAGSLATIHRMSGLTNGVTYVFTVVATNALGPSGPSAPTAGLTPQPVADTSIALTSSVNPSLPGQSVSYSATVTGSALSGSVSVLEGATPLAGCEAVGLNGSQGQCVDDTLPLGKHNLIAVYSGDALNAGSISPLLVQGVGVPLLDVDGSGAATRYDALTDGLLIIRYLFGVTGAALTEAALGGTASRADAAALQAYLEANREPFDIDGNGTTDALTDGLLILRYLFGLRGSALISGAIDPEAATRNSAPAIEDYLQTLLP